ncbi:F-box protein At3g07870-like [Triticum aestivum]|uniref:F-box protein At3g07870-like n=1 Tax=Triticum aestivum TaxID=4565 RepID=UPI001D01ED4E|nr:F-box protein At3g07870-like [Triticum aestivum]
MTRELSADVLVSIVQRLPPSTRRLTRLVCRHWCDVVDTRTAEMQSRAKLLVTTGEGSAYFVDDPSAGRRRYLWKNNASPGEGSTTTMVVGTCNGLICLRDKRKSDGAITMVNPVTGERLSLPPLPSAAGAPKRTCFVGWGEAYGFGYHPSTTGASERGWHEAGTTPRPGGTRSCMWTPTLGKESCRSR